MKNAQPDFQIQTGQHMQEWTNAVNLGVHFVSSQNLKESIVNPPVMSQFPKLHTLVDIQQVTWGLH